MTDETNDKLIQALLEAHRRDERRLRDRLAVRLDIAVPSLEPSSTADADAFIWAEIGKCLAKQQRAKEEQRRAKRRKGTSKRKGKTGDERLRKWVLQVQRERAVYGEKWSIVEILREVRKHDDVWRRIKKDSGFLSDASPEDFAQRVYKAAKPRKTGALKLRKGPR